MIEPFRGYVRTENKRPCQKFGGGEKLLTPDQASGCYEYAGVLNGEFTVKDMDDAAEAEKLHRLVVDKDINCRVMKTTRGMQFFFKSSRWVRKNLTHEIDALGLEFDTSTGRNAYCVLKFGGKQRDISDMTFSAIAKRLTDDGVPTPANKKVWQPAVVQSILTNEKYKGGFKCGTPHVTEDEVKEAFLAAFNKLLDSRDELIENCRIAQGILCDTAAIDTELDELRREIEVVVELSRKAINENARVAQDQEAWTKRNNGYLERHRIASERVGELEDLKQERSTKKLTLDAFICELESRQLAVDEFDERLFAVAVDIVKVRGDGQLAFRFKDGTEI
ncbi:MAG: recombinase family protein [Clostridiales Family XIII bacterium]|jgi:hypothetical protein|nr:recombinase family protein [Clostridiales Family XIII bacterium]